jgi:hypothetical protein
VRTKICLIMMPMTWALLATLAQALVTPTKTSPKPVKKGERKKLQKGRETWSKLNAIIPCVCDLGLGSGSGEEGEGETGSQPAREQQTGTTKKRR